MRQTHHQRGFSLIELVIVMAIVGVLSATAIPAFTQWVRDAKTRTVAEAVQNAIRLAQAEALKRSTPVQFVLTADTPNSQAATVATSGLNWVIRSIDPLQNPLAFIQGGNFSTTSNTSSVSAVSPNTGVLTFNSIGRLVTYNTSGIPSNGQTATFSVTSSINTSSSLQLNVVVSPSGSVRMCNAAKVYSSTTPEGC